MGKKDNAAKAIQLMLPAKYYDDIYVSKLLRRSNFSILPPGKILWCFRHGFLPHEYLLYDLDFNDYRDYVPSRNNLKNRTLNGVYNAILANKIIFERQIEVIIKGLEGLKVIKNLAYIENGVLKALNKNIVCGDFSSLLPYLEENDLILKPVMGDGGVGFIMIRKVEGDFMFNKKRVNWKELCESLGKLDNMLIQERFIQHGFSHEIYPESVNTMRIATMIDPVTNKPFIGYAFHRFGSPHSGFIDNVNQGGLFCLIDTSDGKLTNLVDYSLLGDKKFFDYHPFSNKKVINERVPGWSKIAEVVLEMAGRMPYLKYVGWDIVLSYNEMYVLEGNVSPGTAFQLYKPMKKFPGWDFFRHYHYC